jgi:ABC-2 type transport system permease protein
VIRPESRPSDEITFYYPTCGYLSGQDSSFSSEEARPKLLEAVGIHHGTLEQLLVSPVRAIEIFLAKIIPTIVLVLGLSSLSFLLVLKPAFHVPIRGSIVLFYLVAALCVFAMTSMGIAIAVVADNLAQAMMIMLLILHHDLPVGRVESTGGHEPMDAVAQLLVSDALLYRFRVRSDSKRQRASVRGWDIAVISILGCVLFSFSLVWFRRSVGR